MSTRKGEVVFCTRGEWLAFVKRQLEPLTRRAPHRNEERMPFVCEVILVPGGEGAGVRRRLMLINISNSGLMLKGETEIEEGIEALIEINPDGKPFHVVGVVRHCTQTLGGFKIGVNLRFV